MATVRALSAGVKDPKAIESVNDTLEEQLDLEPHGGRTIDGVPARIPDSSSP